MFRKSTHADHVKKSAQKITDTKKDNVTRLKHLRIVLENYDSQEAKTLFDANYSNIYYIFYDNFINAETDLKARVNKAHKEELEAILHIFEKILLFLPELIHKRWMFHSIGRIMKKLLHPGNVLKLRREGMRLFIIWYQELQQNASDECHSIFLSLVPELGNHDNSTDTAHSDMSSHDSMGGVVSPGEITALLPSCGEKQPDNVTKYFFESLLTFMVSEVVKVEWTNKEMRDLSFVFLFDKFKASYLQWVLPDFDQTRSVYNPCLDLPGVRQLHDILVLDVPEHIAQCQDSLIRWLSNFAVTSRRPDPVVNTDKGNEEAPQIPPEPGGDHTDNAGSQTSTLTSASQALDKDSADSSMSSDGDDASEYEIVRSVLFSTRDNVNIVQELFRQALLLSFKHAHAMKRVVAVYKEWFHHVDILPAFMQEPPNIPHADSCRGMVADNPNVFLSDILEESSSDESPVALPSHLASPEWLDDPHKTVRNASYLGAVEDLADASISTSDVRVGIQRLLQVFITDVTNVFLLDVANDESMLLEQVELCKKVLNIFRRIVMNVKMSHESWEQLLRVLLCITSGVLHRTPPADRTKTLGGHLAPAIVQTLIVTWIKANLHVFISVQLWDEFLVVLSSLTDWEDLIREWAKTMETLTRVLARHVYNLDLSDLPLQRLSEQKEKRRRGKSQEQATKQQVEKEKVFPRTIFSPQVPQTERTFERGKLSKSDGAGSGARSRGELRKQRSLSSEPRCTSGQASPSHSRSPSTASDTHGNIKRSNSDDNLYMPDPTPDISDRTLSHDVMVENYDTTSSEQVADNSTSTLEDQEIAAFACFMTDSSSMTSSDSVPIHYKQLDTSVDACDQQSEPETVVRESHTPSPVSLQDDSRPSSPLLDESPDTGAPEDRDSLHIDIVAASSGLSYSTDDVMTEYYSVLSGGTVEGWMEDVAVVLWRRMLGGLGDINRIQNPTIHAMVYDNLCGILTTLIQMRDNLGVTADNMSSPTPPEMVPPQQIFAPWCFECLQLPDTYKEGKLLARKLLCMMLVRSHDMPLPPIMLSRLYHMLHYGLTSQDQDVINVLIRCCGARFFSTPLAGRTMLLLDFISAAATIINNTELTDAPRVEAVSLLGSLVCFSNHFKDMPVLQPNHHDMFMVMCSQAKDQIINLLLTAGKNEPAALARCIAVSSLGTYLYEELTHKTTHVKLKEAINVMLTTLRASNKEVAMAACDMLLLLCDHVYKLLAYHPELPKKIIQVISSNISSTIPTLDSCSSPQERRLITGLMFCMVEWCMRLPLPLLIETSDTEKSCLYKVFRVLNAAISGHTTSSLSRGIFLSLIDGVLDLEPAVPPDSVSSEDSLSQDSPTKQKSDSAIEPSVNSTQDQVKLAAKVLINHLVNHLAHFPMASGAPRLNSNVCEHHDFSMTQSEDLDPSIFNAPNIQFFVLNKRSLVSFVELPALLDVPGGGVTAGLTTAKTVARVIVRDVSGKFCWESSVLYGPPWCQKPYTNPDAGSMLSIPYNLDQETATTADGSDIHTTDGARRSGSFLASFSLPKTERLIRDEDRLDELLSTIGATSPECLLVAGERLGQPSHEPDELSSSSVTLMTEMVDTQKMAEHEFYQLHKYDFSMQAKPESPVSHQSPESPFHMCRMLLDHMGLLSWDKRCHIDLLKKSDKLLRELKHLDTDKCRDTHKTAVIYVAVGQEDKQSILSNRGGSKAYEDFVAGLGWEVELDTHQGFLGGLQPNKTTGDTMPYYATSACEIAFHVATRMPSLTQDDIHRKLKHLGNDEVHVIWSEHTRDYRHGIIPTDFGDVIIVIYPLNNGLFRIQILTKSPTPFFGPLFDGAIINRQVLPALIRATAVNASRLKRSLIPHYQSFYEERSKCLEKIVENHTHTTMFEEFTANVFAPVFPTTLGAGISQADGASPSAGSSVSDDTQMQTSTQLPSPTTRNTREISETFLKTAKRLSMKSRRMASGKSVISPPNSPNSTKK